MRLNTIVIDNGTGFTKMGYGGNKEPNFIIPTCVADKPLKRDVQISSNNYDYLDFYVGEEAQKRSLTYNLEYPLQSGEVSNFDLMEKLWHRCIYDFLRCEPEEHFVMLTEPPMNSPANRELMAEIMFETFNVSGLHIGVQATLALYSSWFNSAEDSIQKSLGLTGTVVDSGDGVTHIIPIADGYVIGSCIKHIPLAGSDITKFVANAIKERGYKIPAEDLKGLAKALKDEHAYVSEDPVQEMLKWDNRVNSKNKLKFKPFTYKSILSDRSYEVDVGYECFMGPEMFFRPEIVSSYWSKPLDQELDEAIVRCPIDVRRNLYKNIILSGGSAQTEGLQARLDKTLRARVENRMAENYEKLKTKSKPKPIEVNVSSSPYNNFAVWNGGSMMSQSSEFPTACHTRKDYLENGPSIARHNAVFMKQ